jgi:TnpA family transposase
MIDVIYSQDAGQRPGVIITDTGAYSDIVFALIMLLGFDYRPGLADLPDAKLWRLDPRADCRPLNARPAARSTRRASSASGRTSCASSRRSTPASSPRTTCSGSLRPAARRRSSVTPSRTRGPV